jgi:hypothetical protein
MKIFMLVFISMISASIVHAKDKDLDREKYDYYCGTNFEWGFKDQFKCPELKKGDILVSIRASYAVLYCDRAELILTDQEGRFESDVDNVTCVYNGRPIKQMVMH